MTIHKYPSAQEMMSTVYAAKGKKELGFIRIEDFDHSAINGFQKKCIYKIHAFGVTLRVFCQ